MMHRAIRVLVADDHRLVRAGIRAVLAGAADIEVVGEAASGREAVRLTMDRDPDVVVMDISMGDMDGIEATRLLACTRKRTKVLVVSVHDESQYIAEAIEAGAAGYLLKTLAHRELVPLIRAVASADTPANDLAGRFDRCRDWPALRLDESTGSAELTFRERAVRRLLDAGYAPSDIGIRLSITTDVVEACQRRVTEKLRLTSSRRQLASAAGRRS
jgi:DNA-binding NarL/FixJ family response regulator